MANLQKQILDLFAECEPDLHEVIVEVIQFELENIHLKEPRYTRPIMDILDRVARETMKDVNYEA